MTPGNIGEKVLGCYRDVANVINKHKLNDEELLYIVMKLHTHFIRNHMDHKMEEFNRRLKALEYTVQDQINQRRLEKLFQTPEMTEEELQELNNVTDKANSSLRPTELGDDDSSKQRTD